MILQPITGWWLLLPMIIVAGGYMVWLIFQERKRRSVEYAAWIRRGALVALLALIVAGPSMPGGTTSPGVANLDIVFVVDTTASMGAEDYKTNKQRIEGVKTDLELLAQRFAGAHVAVITFDARAEVLLPFTTDQATLGAAIKSLNQEMFNTSIGTSIDRPIELISQQLKNSKQAYPQRQRLLFYFGDGEQTTKEQPKSFASLASYLNGGAVLGYGTTQGGKMIKYTGLEGLRTDRASNVSYIQTPNPTTKQFVPAVSKIDEQKLKDIANQLGIAYVNRNRGGDIGATFSASRADVLIDKSKKITHYVNMYWIFAVPLVGLVFWEWHKILGLYTELKRSERKSLNA